MRPSSQLPLLVGHAMYDAFTTSAHIPFDYRAANDAVPFTQDVHAAVQLVSDDGTTSRIYHPIIDTGSCGFVISAADLPDWDEAEAALHPVGWEFLSSSKILYTGHWLPRDIYFPSATAEIQARIPILAVETRTRCPHYNATRDKNVCPTTITGPTAETTAMPRGIRVLGVGFGREHDGMPQGTPDKNPLINVQTLDGDVTPPDFRNGYVLTRKGISVGLTAANTAHMHFAELALRDDYVSARDWAQVDGCMGVDAAECVPGPALLDTGVAQMYMTLPLGSKVRRTKPPVLDDGSVVEVRIGQREDGTYIAQENFTVGDEPSMRYGVVPSSVRLTLANPAKNHPHVNTGRHFLRAWDTAFDSDGGYFGLRRVREQ